MQYENYHLRHFLTWLGGRELAVALIMEYRSHLQSNSGNKGTKRCRWARAKKYFWTRFTPEQVVKEFAWAEYLIPFSGETSSSVYRPSKAELTRMMSVATNRQRCWMQVLATPNIRLTEALNLRPTDPRITSELKSACEDAMGKGEYLLISKTGKKLTRGNVSKTVTRLGKRVLNKRLSAESFRRKTQER